MLIKVTKNAKDTSEFCKAPALSRRDFLAKSSIMGILSILGPRFLVGQNAYAATLNCPPSTLVKGGFGQVVAKDGINPFPIFTSVTYDSMNANMASNYGITGASTLVQAGSNWMTAKDSVGGQVLLAGPPGVSATAWAAILKNTALGTKLGDYVQDDGSNSDGLPTGFTGINGKGGPNPTDYRFSTANGGANPSFPTPAKFATGASTSLSNPTPATLSATLSTVPPSAGLTTSTDFTASTTAALAIESAFETLTPVSQKKGGAQMLNSAGCGFNNNPQTASPTYGTNAYTATGISAITTLAPQVSTTTMTPQNLAILAAAYESGLGFSGGVIMTNPNCDVHTGGGTPTRTGTQEQINASAVVAMLAGFAAANAPGVIIINSNGSVSCSGNGPVTVTNNGANLSTNNAQAVNDNGSTYSAGHILFYSPTGNLPTPSTTGTINTTTGSTKGSAGSQVNAQLGLMASALYFLNNGTVPNSFYTAAGQSAATINPWMVVG